MSFRSFLISVRCPETAESELNQFLRSHRILSVEHEWVDRGENSFWAVWVEYLEASPPAIRDAGGRSEKGKVDYKERLSAEDFATYLHLRDLRKTLAADDGVALYAVFTNNQMAEMVEQRVRTRADLAQIAGVGDARVEKYAERVLAVLNSTRGKADEKDGEPAAADR